MVFICSVDDVDGIDLLRWEDQQMIRKYVECGRGGGSSGGGSTVTNVGSSSKSASVPLQIEVSQTSRATCRNCSEKIMKGEVNYQGILSCKCLAGPSKFY